MVSAVCRQTFVTLVAAMISFNVGIAFSWTSPNNSKLRDVSMKDTPLDRVPSYEEMSWIAPITPLGAAISPFMAAPLIHIFGAKKVLLSTAVIYIVAYLILGFGKNLALIYVARLIHGFGVGFNMTGVPNYIGEISQDNDRGSLGNILMLYFTSGVLFSYAVGPYVPYVIFQFICLIFPIVYIVAFAFMPESPFYTLMRGDTEKTKKILKFLRGNSEEVIMAELQEIKSLIDVGAGESASWSELFTNKGHLKALLICAGLVLMQQFSGINAVVMYAQFIFEKVDNFIQPEISAIIIGVTEVVGNFFTTLVIERFGARNILLVSNVGMLISMGLLGLYFFMLSEKMSIVNSLGFLPITALIVYIFIFSIGFGTIPWALTGEMFPSEVKTSAAMLVSSTCYISAFIVTKCFESFDSLIGLHWVFWMFTIFLVIGLVLTYLYVFETKDLTLQQIQDKLNSKN